MSNVKIYTIFKNTDEEFTGTRKEIAKHFNIPYNTLKNRINKMNLSIEEAINYNKNYKKYTVFKGTIKEFTGTLYEIAKHFNINYNTLLNRINKINLSIEDAIEHDLLKIYNVFKGTNREFIGNLKEISKHFNIKYNILQYRIHKMNLSIEEAIDYSEYINIVFEGTDREFVGTKKEIADHFDISYGTLIKRINNEHLSIENAIDYTLKSKNKIYTVFKGTNNEFTGSIRKIAKHFHINYLILISRINNLDLSLEETILLPLNRVKQNNLTYKGEKGSMRELCKKFDKNYIEVYNKVKYNHTFEWSMDSTEKQYKE